MLWALQAWVDLVTWAKGSATDMKSQTFYAEISAWIAEPFCFHVLTIYCWILCWIFKLSYTIVTCCLWPLWFLPYPALAQTPKYWKFKSAGLYLDEQICAHMKCPYKHKLYHKIQIISMSHTPLTNTALPLNPNNHHITNFMWDTII